MANWIHGLAITGMMTTFGFLGVESAEAAHGKYCYKGTCHNFHGESHVVSALSLMDQALLAECPRERAHAILAAQDEVMTAYREFCQFTAKHELIRARIQLSRFLGCGNPIWLDRAAGNLNAALVLEQRVHVKPVHCGASHIGPGYGLGQAHPGYRRHGSRSYVRFGGPKFSIGFGF